MLSTIREHADSWMIKSILWMIIFAFIGTIFYSWGMGGASGKAGGAVATVEGEKIYQQEYERTFTNLVEFYRQQFKNQFSDAMIKQLNLKNQALEALIQKKLLLIEANKQNLKISDEELIAHIRKLPVFQTGTKFSEKTYRNYLKYQRVSPSDFEDSQRESLILTKLENLFKIGTKVSKEEIQKAFTYREEKAKLDFVRFNTDHFQTEKIFKDEELNDFFEANKKKFEIHPQIKVEYVKVNSKSFLAEIKPREEDIVDYYQTKVADFQIKKTYGASHILIHIKTSEIGGDASQEEKQKKAEEKSKARAQELVDKIKQGEDFGELAKKHSDDPGSGSQGGSLGQFPKGTMVSAFEATLDKLKINEVSKPILTPFGYHIIKLESIEEKRIKTIEEVREQIIETLKEIKSRQRARRLIKRVHQEAEKTGDLSSAAQKNNTKINVTEFFSREKHRLLEIGEIPEFYNAAFSLKGDEISQPINSPEASFVLKVSGNKNAYIPELSEVKKTVEQAFKERLNKEYTLTQYKEMQQKLNNEQSLEKAIQGLDLSVRHTPFFSKADSIPGIGNIQEIKEVTFEMKVGETASANVRNRYYLLKLTEKEAGGEPEKEDVQRITQQIKQNKSRQSFQEWVENLKTSSEILIDKTLM